MVLIRICGSLSIRAWIPISLVVLVFVVLVFVVLVFVVVVSGWGEKELTLSTSKTSVHDAAEGTQISIQVPQSSGEMPVMEAMRLGLRLVVGIEQKGVEVRLVKVERLAKERVLESEASAIVILRQSKLAGEDGGCDR